MASSNCWRRFNVSSDCSAVGVRETARNVSATARVSEGSIELLVDSEPDCSPP